MTGRLILLLILPVSLFAQKTPANLPVQSADPARGNMQAKAPFGITDQALFEKYMPLVAGVGVSSKELLSEQNLKAYMMPPRKTGEKGFSYTYTLASALEFYANMNNNYKDNLSPDYIRIAGGGTTMEEGLLFLANNGTVSAAAMPYDAPSVTPAVYSAPKYRIKNYLKLFQPTTRGLQKIYELRKAIMRGNPVLVELEITNGFRNLTAARFWKPEEGDKTPAGKHYLVAVGFDEERKAVELLNNWGREWGNSGYIWVSYDDFGERADAGYVLIPQ